MQAVGKNYKYYKNYCTVQFVTKIYSLLWIGNVKTACKHYLTASMPHAWISYNVGIYSLLYVCLD